MITISCWCKAARFRTLGFEPLWFSPCNLETLNRVLQTQGPQSSGPPTQLPQEVKDFLDQYRLVAPSQAALIQLGVVSLDDLTVLEDQVRRLSCCC